MEPRGNELTSRHLDGTFLALADPTRRAILARLALGEASVTELAAPFAISQPAISKHLRVLERAGLITAGQDAQRRPRRLEPRALQDASRWLDQCREAWEANFGRLDRLLADMQRPGSPTPRGTRFNRKAGPTASTRRRR
jgi:DNA-binding transcriptional ArsR family regulator